MTNKKIAEAKKLVADIRKKTGSLNQSDIIAVFRRFSPSSSFQCKAIGLKLKYVGAGCFRSVYSIEQQGLVAKFPKGKCDIEHSLDEIVSIQYIKKRKKYKPVHRWLPKVFYHNKKTGVLILQQYQTLIYNGRGKTAISILSGLLQDIGLSNNDVHPGNLGYDREHDDFKILDLGILGED